MTTVGGPVAVDTDMAAVLTTFRRRTARAAVMPRPVLWERRLPGKDTAMTGTLKDQTVLIIGRGSGLARAIALASMDAGAQVIAAGRDREKLSAAYAGESGVSTETVDLTEEAALAALGGRLGAVDHVVSTASARARGRIADLDRDAIRLSFDTKVIGPLMLAKHFAPRINQGGSFTLFSGVAAAKIAVGTLGVAITNAAAASAPPTTSPGPSCSP